MQIHEHKITLTELKKEIKRQNRAIKKGRQRNFNFLGYVETKDLSENVISLFRCFERNGILYYNWISGNDRMQKLIKETVSGIKK